MISRETFQDFFDIMLQEEEFEGWLVHLSTFAPQADLLCDDPRRSPISLYLQEVNSFSEYQVQLYPIRDYVGLFCLAHKDLTIDTHGWNTAPRVVMPTWLKAYQLQLYRFSDPKELKATNHLSPAEALAIWQGMKGIPYEPAKTLTPPPSAKPLQQPTGGKSARPPGLTARHPGPSAR